MASKEPEAKKDLIMIEGVEYVPLPKGYQRAIFAESGIINKYYEDTLDKIYNAMKDHKVYYDETMAQCNYPVKDIIPSKEIIRQHIMTLDAFLYGWFALNIIKRTDDNGKDVLWATKHSFNLIDDFIEDISNKKTPRVLRS